MDFNNIMDLLLKANIDSDEVSKLILKASTMDISVEENQRNLIREGAKLANKEVTPELEDKIIELLKEKGISNNLFSYLN